MLLRHGEWVSVPPADPREGERISEWTKASELAPDGALWVSVDSFTTEEVWEGLVSGEGFIGTCGGVARLDGEGWHRFLDGYCVGEIEFDVRGNAWLRASRPTVVDGVAIFDVVDTYVIMRDTHARPVAVR